MAPTALVEAGLVQESALGHDGFARHYTDLYWEYQFEHVPKWSFWEIDCGGAVPPATTTTTVPAGTTSGPTTDQEASPPTTTLALEVSTPDPAAPVTTTTQAGEDATSVDYAPVTTSTQAPLQATTAPLPPGYDLFSAQYDGWPFYETIVLLEERYPQGTPGKYHFRLSVAVEYLRADGMIGALDAVWNSGE